MKSLGGTMLLALVCLAWLAALASLACSPTADGTGGALAGSGGPPADVDIVSADYTIANCIKSYSALEEGDLMVPGTHSYSATPQDPSRFMWSCTNTVDVTSTTIDAMGISLDFDIAIQTEFVEPPPGTPENPNPEPDGKLIDPRVVNFTQTVEFVANQPVTLETTAGSDLAGLGAANTQNLIAIEIASSPLAIDASTGAPARGNFYELFYANGSWSTGDNLESQLDFDLDLNPGTYTLSFNVQIDASQGGEFNSDTDLTVTGGMIVAFAPQGGQQQGPP